MFPKSLIYNSNLHIAWKYHSDLSGFEGFVLSFPFKIFYKILCGDDLLGLEKVCEKARQLSGFLTFHNLQSFTLGLTLLRSSLQKKLSQK